MHIYVYAYVYMYVFYICVWKYNMNAFSERDKSGILQIHRIPFFLFLYFATLRGEHLFHEDIEMRRCVCYL